MDFDADLVVDRAGNMGDVLAAEDVSGGGVMGWDGIRSSPSHQANRAHI
jgi:hypothetical protein